MSSELSIIALTVVLALVCVVALSGKGGDASGVSKEAIKAISSLAGAGSTTEKKGRGTTAKKTDGPSVNNVTKGSVAGGCKYTTKDLPPIPATFKGSLKKNAALRSLCDENDRCRFCRHPRSLHVSGTGRWPATTPLENTTTVNEQGQIAPMANTMCQGPDCTSLGPFAKFNDGHRSGVYCTTHIPAMECTHCGTYEGLKGYKKTDNSLVIACLACDDGNGGLRKDRPRSTSPLSSSHSDESEDPNVCMNCGKNEGSNYRAIEETDNFGGIITCSDCCPPEGDPKDVAWVAAIMKG